MGKNLIINGKEYLDINNVKIPNTDGGMERFVEADDFVTKEDFNSGLDKKVDKEDGKQLSTNDYTDEDKQKLDNIEDGAEVNKLETIKVNGEALEITDKGADIPVPTKTSDLVNDSNFVNMTMLNEGLGYKQNAIPGKSLSTNDYTNEDKEKVASIPESIRFRNITVPIGSFVSDDTFEDYPYKANISIEGVLETDYANVFFSLSDIQSKIYASICTTGANIVTIYSSEIPTSDTVIDLIEVVKV